MRETDLRAVGKSFNRVSTKGVMFKDEGDDRQGAQKKAG
jgi:hypothetical protein